MLKKLHQGRHRRYGPLYKQPRKRAHIGVDTETYRGYCRLLCDSRGNITYPVTSFLQILQLLSAHQYRGTWNWFWNIDYDVESIIKWAPVEVRDALVHDSTVIYQGYTLRYFKEKSFEISYKKHRTRFYDMSNFLEMSLEEASQDYLGEGKNTDIDPGKLNTDKKYWADNLSRIIPYCARDAILTGRLAEWWWSLVEEKMGGFIPENPQSAGSISQQYFLSRTFVPQVYRIPVDVQRYAHETYYGGRFEILKQGYFPEAFCYDIKSAYPAIIAQLPDFGRGTWFCTDEFRPEAEHGFWYCYVEAFNDVISPFMQKEHGSNVYPNGRFYQYLTSYEIRFILERMPGNRIEIIDGYYWIPDGRELRPFEKEIERLYTWKESEKDLKVKGVVKVFMNSLSGKFFQTIGSQTGKLYNPLYAAECSARTRLKLLEVALAVGPKNVIEFSTDAIHTTTPFIPVQNRADALGDFALDITGEGLYIGTDKYTIWNQEKSKYRFRGRKEDEDFELRIIEDERPGQRRNGRTLQKVLLDMGSQDRLEIQVKRPFHTAECLSGRYDRTLGRHLTPEDVNCFYLVKQEIRLNSDTRREWDRPLHSGRDALSNNISSIPLVMGDFRCFLPEARTVQTNILQAAVASAAVWILP